MRKTNSRYLNIVIPEAVAAIIQAKVDSGEYPSLGAAVRAALTYWLTKEYKENLSEDETTLYQGARIDIPNRKPRSAKYVRKTPKKEQSDNAAC